MTPYVAPSQLPDVNIYAPGQEPPAAPEDTGVSLSAPAPSAQDPDTGVSLASPGAPTPLLPADVADQRAKKIQEGIGQHLDKTTDEIKQDLNNGQENALRAKAASTMTAINQQQKYNTLVDLANAKGGPLDEDEVSRILDPYNPKNRPVSPDSVVETQYATKYIGSIQEAINSVPNNPVQDAQQEIPEQAQESFLKGSDLEARMEAYRKIREDMEAAIGQQSYVGRAVDMAKQMWQPYTEAKLRGLTPGVGYLEGGDIGSNLQAQADHIFTLPIDESIKLAAKITQGLAKDNPQLGLRFAQYLEGLPSSDRILDGAFSYLAPMDIAGLGKMGLSVARKISLLNRTNKAVRDMVKAADVVQTDKAARAEAAGDVDTAAEQRSTDLILQNMNGQSNPIKIATDDSLLTVLNQGRDKLGTDTGKLSREQVVRIQDAYDASGKTLLERIINAARINRIPMPLATRNAVKILRDAVQDYYPGIRNAILDVSNPLYEAKSNTFWHEITFGNFGGKLFSNPDTAKNFAKLHGLDARIVEGSGSITSPEMEKMLERKAYVEKTIPDIEQTIIRRQKEASDPKLTIQNRAKAKEQADGLKDHLKTLKNEADDLDLKIKGGDTYRRVKGLENDIEALKIRNKEIRDGMKAEGLDPAVRQHMEDSINFGKEQIRAKAQEWNAIRQGKADVIGSKDTIEQQGVGFKLVVRRPLTETDKAVRDLMIRDTNGNLIPEAVSTGSQTGFKSLMNAALYRFRGADDTLSLNESVNRKIGTYTQSLFKEWANQEAAYIRQIATGVIRHDPVTGESIPYWRAKPQAIFDKLTRKTKSTYNEFVRALDHARDENDPVTGKPGYFFETPGQLDNFYQKFFSRSPSFAENEAYFAFVRMVEGDRIMREISEFRNRARLGVEQFSVSARGADGKAAKSDFFDGRVLKNFPGGDDVMMIMAKKLGEERVVNLGGVGIGPRQLAEYKELVKQGRLKVIEVYASEHTPLRKFSDIAGNEHIRYILTDTSESKPIEFNHVNRRGGGHFEYDYDHFIKQAKMYHQYEGSVKGAYRSVYTGDTTFMPVLNRIMGGDISKKLNEVARLIREGDIEGAKAYTQQHLPIEFDKLHGMFKPGRDEDGKATPPQLDLDPRNPFKVTSKGLTVLDMDKDLINNYGKETFKEGAKSGSLNKQFQVAFNTERESSGLTHLDDVGTQGNPLYKYSTESRMVDPITTMNRSLNRIVNSVYMDDYKMYAVEHWLREAEGHLKANPSEVQSSPFWHFQSSSDKSAFLPGTPKEVVANLLSNRYKIQQFLGVPSTVDTALHVATQWLVDTAYSSMGPQLTRSFAGKAAEIVPLWMINHIKDPFVKMRSFTFHAKLGLWNPAQLLVQMQSFSTILAVSPFHGMAGTYATMLHTWTRMAHDEAFINLADKYASKISVFGQSKWRPGEFKEAMMHLENTGFDKVAGEYANLNTALKTDFVGNDFKNLLNAGTFFFREGEKATRVGAWYTAFREFREANPTGAVSKMDLGKILQRADLLTANMSRASNSSLQSGYLSLTTQFLTYQIRLAELFMGNRIDKMAKLRLFTFYSLLYGAPSAVGLSGLPLQNTIRQEAIERGYKVGDNWLSTAIDQGLPAVALAVITGKGDFQKGNNYNIGERYGSPGFTQLTDAMKSNTPWYGLIAGASGSTVLNTLTSTSNFFHAAASLLQMRAEDKAFPPKLDDLTDVLKEFSSVNQFFKIVGAVNTGKWMSKNEGYIGDVTKANAAFMAILGLSPQQQSDEYIKHNIKSAEIELQKHVMKEATKEYHRYIEAAKVGNYEQAADYYRRVDAMLIVSGFPQDRKGQFLAQAARGFEKDITDSDYAFATKGVPVTKSTFMGLPMPFNTQTNVPQTRLKQFQEQTTLDRYKKQ